MSRPRLPLMAKRSLRAPSRRLSPRPEGLEERLLLASTIYHNDLLNTGANLSETQLTTANVNPAQFGKLASVPLDGYAYAQPLYVPNVRTTTGTNPGTHNVLYVATEHDSLYAIDADAGTVLWKVSFLTSGLPGATSITPVPTADVISTDIVPEIGITATPAIDVAGKTIYVEAKTKEIVDGTAHYVHRLHAIDITSGAEKFGGPVLIGDTFGNSTNNTSIYVYGSGAGAVTDPYNGTGQQVLQFNALLQHDRAALQLVGSGANARLYVAFASHGNFGNDHGWLLAYKPTNLALVGVLCTTPNAEGGNIWQAGAGVVTDGSGHVYVQTGNGIFDGDNGATSYTSPAPGPVTGLDSNGFPINGDYGDSFLKIGPDSTTSPTNQNKNGWGLKVVDYFTPFDEQLMAFYDQDLGSGGPLILPDSAGNKAHPHLMIGAGKKGRIYLVDRDNMGKYGVTDNVVQEANPMGGAFGSPAYFNGTIYYGPAGDHLKSFKVANAAFNPTPTSQSERNFGWPGTTPSISANGTSGAVVWALNSSEYRTQGLSVLYAFDPANLWTEIYRSDLAANGRDQASGAVKFSVPTVINGKVFVGGASALTIYGLLAPAPSGLKATAATPTQVNLTWKNNSTFLTSVIVLASTDGQNFSQLAQLPGNATSYSAVNLNPTTTYTYQLIAVNGTYQSQPSNASSATTPAATGSATFDASAGFVAAAMTFNGKAKLFETMLQITDGGSAQANSAFTTAALDVTRFTTQFSFAANPGASTGDGMTFVLQAAGNKAVGYIGGGLGYGTDGTPGVKFIGRSVAVKFDLYNNKGEGKNSTGLYTNGAPPTVPAIDLTPSGIDLHSGHIFNVAMVYDGTTLAVSITDTTTGATASQSYTVNIPAVLGSSVGYVGFTGGTGGQKVTQNILKWTYTPQSYAARINFQPAGVTSLNGYVSDTGAVYGPQPSGYTYGWNADNSANASVRNSSLSPSVLYDTLAAMQDPSNPYATWTIAVPNGTYSVHVVAGDPSSLDSVYMINVNDALALNGTPTESNPWVEGTVTTTVTNGTIVISSASGALNNKLDYIEITQLAALPTNPPPGGLSAQGVPNGGVQAGVATTTSRGASSEIAALVQPARPATTATTLTAAATTNRAAVTAVASPAAVKVGVRQALSTRMTKPWASWW